MTAVTTILGRVAIIPKGTWNEEDTYSKLNVVRHNGSSYMAIQNVPAGTYPTNEIYWQLLAAKGTSGGIAQMADEFNTATDYAIGDLCVYNDSLYRFVNPHPAVGWDDDEVTAIVTPDFSSSNSYDIGDYVMYNGSYYIFTSAHTSGDDWDSSEVDEINADEFIPAYAYAVGDYVIYNDSLFRFTSAHFTGSWDDDDVVETTIAYEVANKADASEVNTELALKADAADVTDALSTINTTLGQKANSADVTSALALKANTADVDRNLNNYATKDYVIAELANKANASALDGYLPKSGGGSVSGTLHLSGTTDASGTAANNPPLIIGSKTGTHLELDNNEIMGKSNGTTPGDLTINNDGGNTTIGGTVTLKSPLTVGNGGTGATSAANARKNLGANSSGVWEIGVGGTGATTASNARKNLGANSSGVWEIGVGGTGATTAANARKNLGANSSGVWGINVGGTGATTASSARANLGFSLTRDSRSHNEDVPNNTHTIVDQFRLPTGLYIIICSAGFASNSNGGRRYLYLSTDGQTGMGGTFQVQTPPVNGATTIIGFSGFINITEEMDDFCLFAYQNSGSTLEVQARIHYMKIL